eukprot:TRINITY_DN11965_c0_g1_i4.p1 TRINITY_DN11965_c0_g1~~TRINITY_DN11965_c0_g1_i4.p1  ORF type:complete len:493 (+),score=41.43 TRINITY_DN11965_c0_g1_i4:259-1737(+)
MNPVSANLRSLLRIVILLQSFTGCYSNRRHLVQAWLERDICSVNNFEEVDSECTGNYEVIGGLEADPHRFPYLISLQSPNSRVGFGCFFHFCGASLIAPDFVLTAAHCVYDVVGQYAPTSGKMIQQVYAALSPRCRHMAGKGRAKVTDYWYHPQYNPISIVNDIALLKLDKALSDDGPFLEYRPQVPYNIPEGTMVSIVGWGDVNPTENSEKTYNLRKLLKGDLLVLNWQECQAVMHTFTSRNVNDNIMLCAYSRDVDSCAGDSGGPLIATDDSSKYGNYTKDYQAGIVSWGPGQACVSNNTRFPGVYTRVAAYTWWIDGIMSQYSNQSPEQQIPTISTPTIIVEDLLGGITSVSRGCTTQGGCTCKQSWEYDGKVASNCDNPDNDPIGSWCIVESEGGCQPLSVVSRTGEFWDRCTCEKEEEEEYVSPYLIYDDVAKSQDISLGGLCNTTILGCQCEETWIYGSMQFTGCANPALQQPPMAQCRIVWRNWE